MNRYLYLFKEYLWLQWQDTFDYQYVVSQTTYVCCYTTYESLPRTILLQFMEQKVEKHFSFSEKLHTAAYERETECHSVANYLD